MLCHDPRVSDDRNHKVETENPVLMAAEFTLRAFPWGQFEWGHIAKMADIAEEPVVLTIPDNEKRNG